MDKTDSGQQLVRQGPPQRELVRRPQVYHGPDDIRAEIEISRRQIAASLQDLQAEVEQTVKRATDWRGWIDDHPVAAVAGAFAVGFYLGLR